VTSRWGGIRYAPFAFTEQGVAMLSGILGSDRAINVNIAVMRAFIQLRQFLESNKELAIKLEELEKSLEKHDERIQLIFQAIRQLIEKKMEEEKPRRPIGY
jgi:DNA-binding transcriptional MerR regulator